MTVAMGLAEALGQFLESQTPAGSTTGQPPNTLIFSSTLRDRRLPEAAFSSDRVDEGLVRDVGNYFSGFTNSQLRSGLGPIRLALNPHTLRPTQGKRMSRQDTVKGAVFHLFSDDRGQNNDVLTLSFAGSSGGINPDIYSLESDKEKARQRLLIWHSLYQLTRERVVLEDGTPNEFSIVFESNLFPVPFIFHGQYSKVLEWPHDRTKPNSIEYAFDFIVQDTTPSMDDMYEHIVRALTTIVVPAP